MSLSKAVSQVLHTCSVSYFRLSPPFYMEHCLFHEISDTKCPLPTENTVFHQRSLKTVFHSGLGTLGPAFPNTSLHSGHLQGCSQGNMQAGYVCSPPTCLQGQGVMLVARSLNLVGLTSVQSHSSYFHLTIFLDY